MEDVNREFKGVWIPANLYRDTRLTWSQKLMIVEIDSFSRNGLECFVSNEHLSEHLQIGISAVEKCLKSLVDMGLVERGREYVGRSYRRTLRLTPGTHSGLDPESIRGTTRNEVRHTNTVTNTQTKPRTKGRPATNDECIEYFAELGMVQNEAFKFLDWYEQTGWKLKGGNPIKDWKATARNWKRRNNERQAKQTGFQPGNFNPDALHDYLATG